MASFNKRVQQEIKMLDTRPVPGISAKVVEDNTRYFSVVIDGPVGTPYDNGKFELELFLGEDFPMKPPKARFLTKIYHPNIDKLGRICLDTLKDKWTPAIFLQTLLTSIRSLLSTPNPDDPLANDVAEHWKKNEKDAKEKAKEWTRLYATFEKNEQLKQAIEEEITAINVPNEPPKNESDSEEDSYERLERENYERIERENYEREERENYERLERENYEREERIRIRDEALAHATGKGKFDEESE